MKQYPSFTVVTVTYNAGDTIGRTLDSVASQTYEAIEHLIIDGCSSDETMREIHLYVERNTDTKHPHSIRLIREPDRGLYDAMNKAIINAKGDYIVFLNAGDKFHDISTIEKVAATVRRFSAARRPVVAYGETDLVDDSGQFIRHRRHVGLSSVVLCAFGHRPPLPLRPPVPLFSRLRLVHTYNAPRRETRPANGECRRDPD